MPGDFYPFWKHNQKWQHPSINCPQKRKHSENWKKNSFELNPQRQRQKQRYRETETEREGSQDHISISISEDLTLLFPSKYLFELSPSFRFVSFRFVHLISSLLFSFCCSLHPFLSLSLSRR